MKGQREMNREGWNYVAGLFARRDQLKKDLSEEHSHLKNAKIEEVEFIIYQTLLPMVSAIVWKIVRNRAPEDVRKELANAAIYQLFKGYSQFTGAASLKTYFASIVRHFTIDCLEKMCAERELTFRRDSDITQAADDQAVAAFRQKERHEFPESFLKFSNRIFELIDPEEQGLTDSEFVVVTMKFACLMMKKKVSDGELAYRLGMKRTTLVDTFKRGRDKIQRFWKERLEDAEPRDRV